MNAFRQLRASLDALLYKHEIDVCRLFSVFFYCYAVSSICTINLSFILYLFMGYAFWTHTSWPRTVTIGLSWLSIFVSFVVLPAVFLVSKKNPTWTIGGMKIQDPPTWFLNMTLALFVFIIIQILLSLFLLYSEKILKEITTPPSSDPLPTSRLNKYLHFIIVVLFAVLYIGGYLLPHVTNLKEYKAKPQTWISDKVNFNS